MISFVYDLYNTLGSRGRCRYASDCQDFSYAQGIFQLLSCSKVSSGTLGKMNSSLTKHITILFLAFRMIWVTYSLPVKLTTGRLQAYHCYKRHETSPPWGCTEPRSLSIDRVSTESYSEEVLSVSYLQSHEGDIGWQVSRRKSLLLLWQLLLPPPLLCWWHFAI